MIQTDSFEKIEVSSSEELRHWLHSKHSQKESVWLVTYKKSVPEKYLSTSAVLDELLCFGWIDGIRRKLDDERTMQLISPRRIEHWAKSYKDRAAKLIQEGKMQESGFQSIEVSKKNGMWDFMEDVDNLIIPKDLQDALAKYSDAAAFFYAINDSSKRFVLRWIKLAKSEKTRASRIEEIAQLSAKGQKLKGS
ncbi:YdeI/OmpD-associated family protein [Belliella sp. R4-6]|uniref:YdeI/OmpD-associated family protein n=1 Tax=Belliella alkalica TaxID=1730871 RepID=A0ABS9VDK8_9BACT|nr:YdeI/OmpD-associated family protein [Belliella alkalica]MCH7414528.1 YdeI/OmpD-associated family protein [Belliella alkalica]